MKCINKKTFISAFVLLLILLLSGCSSTNVNEYEKSIYDKELYKATPFSSELCISNENVMLDAFPYTDGFKATALFELGSKDILLSSNVHEKLYPASTTKIMTLYLALKYGDLSDTVTVSANATSVPSDSSVANLAEGDRVLLEDLLYGLMLPSGNDAAVALAEHISGSVGEFVNLMNFEAQEIGATNTHFVNPHGYHDSKHYTTVYDMYLMLNKAIANPEFCKIVRSNIHTASITAKDGSNRSVMWQQSNCYINGQRVIPNNISILGGKTGTTGKAGACLALHVQAKNGKDYIAILMGADSRTYLYDCMTFLLSAIPNS